MTTGKQTHTILRGAHRRRLPTAPIRVQLTMSPTRNDARAPGASETRPRLITRAALSPPAAAAARRESSPHRFHPTTLTRLTSALHNRRNSGAHNTECLAGAHRQLQHCITEQRAEQPRAGNLTRLVYLWNESSSRPGLELQNDSQTCSASILEKVS